MPSIEQCEAASGSVAALPSTLEIFDKFKSVSDNGKDSDSEESFHLPLDDDDMENQSVVSNGRDKEIHNEETEDDILNKFETVPSGTPDQIDPHIEDTILDEVENTTGKEKCDGDLESESLTDHSLSKNQEPIKDIKETEESTPQIEKPSSEALADEDRCQEASKTVVEIKLTYDYGDYEDSGDGEFKSVYEIEEVTAEPTIKASKSDSAEHAETIEPMEITDDLESVECIIQEADKLQPAEKTFKKPEETLDNFEDSMEVEQEDTNQDIANIIEKLEGQDTPMRDVGDVALNDEEDVNMGETCDETALTCENSTVTNSDKHIPEKTAVGVEENSDDVEMSVDTLIEADTQENCKENLNQVENNESTEVATTFQSSLEESKDTTKTCSEEASQQIPVNNDQNKETSSENESKIEDQAVTKENKKVVEDQESLVESEETSKNLVEKTENQEEKSNGTSQDISLLRVTATESEQNVATESSSVKLKEIIETENVPKNAVVKSTEKHSDDLHTDDLLRELDQTINESDKDVQKVTEDKEMQEITDDKKIQNATKDYEQIDTVTEDDKEIGTVTKDDKEIEKIRVHDKEVETVTEEDQEIEKVAEDNRKAEKKETDRVKEVENDSKQTEKAANKDEEIFKVPEEVCKVPEELSTQKEEKEGPDLQNDKSNDKTDEDESDLLDISMVRETEEDDACAIADAMDDKDAQVSERSDEEQSEKVETEQETSDIDKDNEDNDNEPIDFDDTDEDFNMDSEEQDDTLNGESTKNKIDNICESSKDSASDIQPKQRKEPVDSSTDVSNDITYVEASASESGEEPDKMEVSDNLVPDKSLNLDSTVAQDDDASRSATAKEPLVPSVPTEDDTAANQVQDEDKTSDISKTDKDASAQAKETSESPMEPTADSLPEVSKTIENTEKRRSSQNKRPLSGTDQDNAEISAKKAKLAPTAVTNTQIQKEPVEKAQCADQKTLEKDLPQDTAAVNEKVKTLTGFSKFMQCRKFTAKLSRSDLEQFCIQKICESLMLKSSEGELHQTIKKHEKTIDVLRKDLQQLTKQCKDLEIVNKKLMNELRNQNALKKPLVPLKITRSVGLQVRLNPGNETPNQNRRRQPITTSTPQKQVVNTTNTTVNRAKVTTTGTQQSPVVRQVLQSSPQKSPLTSGQTTTNSTPTNPLLSQALQQQKPRQTQAVAAKRTAAPVRKPLEASKPAGGNPGVIDLTDEDDKSAAATKTVTGSTIKIINKAVSSAGTPNKALTLAKMVPGKTAVNQGKQKTVTVGQNKGNAISQGIRLTPASVITSSANGSPQMVYVVPTITSNSGGTQKVAFVNFQPTNGVLSGTLNGSTVSVMSNKGQTLTLKTVPSPMRNKHPASLPAPPRINLDPKLKPLLPKPHLTIKKIDTGIILQWKMPYNLDLYESIASYQLYAYQETSSPPSTDMWRKVGDVKALALPMACTLTQFADKNKYYFAVRSVDVHKRIGAFSEPEEISL